MNTSVQSFSERYAVRAMGIYGSLVLMLVGNLLGGPPSRSLLFAAVAVLLMSYGFRRRAMYDEQRRNEVMEDERDAQIQARGAAWARAVLAVGAGALAIALAVPALASALIERELLLAHLVVFVLAGSNFAANFVIRRLHRQDRS